MRSQVSTSSIKAVDSALGTVAGAKTWRDRFVDSTGVLSQVLGEGCQEKSSASTEAASSLASLGKLWGLARCVHTRQLPNWTRRSAVLSQYFHLTARFQVPANCLNLHYYFFEAGFSSRS